MELSEKGGITSAQLNLLTDRKVILENLCWKPDQATKSGKRIFFPYLEIGFVKSRLIEVCGAANVQFLFEKDQEKFGIGRMGIFVEGEWIWNVAVGTERDSKLKDETKRNKVIFKGNHSDAYVSCASLFGLIVPRDIKMKMLAEKDKVVFTEKNKQIGNIEYNKEAINAYLNNMNQSIVMMAQVYKSNEEAFKAHPEADKKFREIAEFLKSEGK
jgi:hypothetical protein